MNTAEIAGTEPSASEHSACRAPSEEITGLLLDWFDEHGSHFPWRHQSSPYGVFVAESLLKRTTATAVNRVYLEFLARYPTLVDLANAREADLVASLGSLGLQYQRAQSMKAAANWLIDVERGVIPHEFSKLAAIPGIGEYSAAAICSFAFGQRAAIVDSNVVRIISRLFVHELSINPSRKEVGAKLNAMLPVVRHRDFNYALLDLGRNVCRYAIPLCEACPLNEACQYPVAIETDAVRGFIQEGENSIGNTVRNLRKSQGKSLQQLAIEAKISKLTLIRTESGSSLPRRETLRKISSALGVGLDGILQED